MKKTLVAFIAISIVFPLGFASAQTINLSDLGITSSTPAAQRTLILEQDLLALYQQLNTLIQEVNQLEANQPATASQGIQSSQLSTSDSPILGDIGSTSTLDQLRSYTVSERAQLNFESGQEITPGQTIEGRVVFICNYDSSADGLPDSCTPPDGSTSTLPAISNAPITIEIKSTSWVSPTSSTPIDDVINETADVNGNFSFVVPGDCSYDMYQITIANGTVPFVSQYNGTSASYFLSGINAPNSEFQNSAYSESKCQSSIKNNG